MKRRKTKGFYILVVLLCFMLSGVFSGTVFAADTPTDGDLTISFVKNDVSISGANFKLYHVGNVAGNGEITLVDAFSKYSVTIPQSGAAASEWNRFASTLSGYAAADNLAVEKSGTTDANGNVTFAGLNRSGQQKVYLLVGDPCTIGDRVYTVQPSMIAVPGWTLADGWYSDVTVRPKSEVVTYTERSVVKTWNDAGQESHRPESITVQLVDATGDQSVVKETVKLNAENHWSYTWTKLDNDRNWQIVEKDVAYGYKVSTEVRDGVTYIINSLTPSGDDPTPPSNPPDEPPSTPPDVEIPDNPPPTGEMEPPKPIEIPGVEIPEPEVPLAERLPQTGVLWWPVPIMAMAGIVMLAAGLVFRRREQM